MWISNLIILFLQVFKPKKVKFKQWVELEIYAEKINEAVENRINDLPELVISYVSTALKIPKYFLRKVFWAQLFILFGISKNLNIPTKIPLLQDRVKTNDKKVGWDYPDRLWNYYSHLLCKEYGWSLEYVSKLSVDIALAHIQEIFVDEQLEREFLWGMSEIAYPYNPTTKQSKFSPLPRPYFMAESAPKLRKFKIRQDMLPVGVVNDLGGMEKYIQEEASSKVIEP